MATLYVRNVPPELYAELKRWAEESGRSVNAEVLELLEGEVAARTQRANSRRKLAAYWRKYEPIEGPPWPEDLIREHRDGGERLESGH